jgi:hypothetical protein
MKTIETMGRVSPDGTLTIQVPPDVEPGEHQVVVVIDDPLPARNGQIDSLETGPAPLDFPVRNYGPWPSGLSLRREDMYDDGR